MAIVIQRGRISDAAQLAAGAGAAEAQRFRIQAEQQLVSNVLRARQIDDARAAGTRAFGLEQSKFAAATAASQARVVRADKQDRFDRAVAKANQEQQAVAFETEKQFRTQDFEQERAKFQSDREFKLENARTVRARIDQDARREQRLQEAQDFRQSQVDEISFSDRVDFAEGLRKSINAMRKQEAEFPGTINQEALRRLEVDASRAEVEVGRLANAKGNAEQQLKAQEAEVQTEIQVALDEIFRAPEGAWFNWDKDVAKMRATLESSVGVGIFPASEGIRNDVRAALQLENKVGFNDDGTVDLFAPGTQLAQRLERSWIMQAGFADPDNPPTRDLINASIRNTLPEVR